jgi:dTDP-4-amino-4,6-dideoxygalactose transaminase
VLVDIDPVTFNIDPAQTVARHHAETKAIIPVHLFGCAPISIRSWTRRPRRHPGRRGRAQAIGATYKSRSAGGIGAFGCFSFFPEQESRRVRRRRPRDTNDDALADAARCCARTAWSRSTTTTWSAPISAWTRCRRRCCA